MKDNQIKIPELLLRIIAPAVFIFIGTCIIFPFAKGMPVFFIPKAEKVARVEICNILTDEIIITDDAETIELAVNLKNFITYKVGSSFEANETGTMHITYFLIDGTEISFSADETTFYRNGKGYVLKESGIFIKIADTVFF